MAVTYNLEKISGEDFSFVAYWEDETGTAYDITGAKARLWLKKDKESGTVDAQITSEYVNKGSYITISGEEGKLTVVFNYQTTQLLLGKYYYDLKVEIDGTRPVLMEGTIVFKRGVTQ